MQGWGEGRSDKVGADGVISQSAREWPIHGMYALSGAVSSSAHPPASS